MPDDTNDDSLRDADDPLRYATGYHAPVLYKTVRDYLITDPAGVYVDGTLGGGGHSAVLLDALGPEATVVGIDQDADALAAAGKRLAAEKERGRFCMLHGNFGDLEKLLAQAGIDAIDGLLLDLGVSSHQIDVPERGFSYVGEGELDMRMDARAGVTAMEVVNRWSEDEVRRVLYEYGEEHRGRQIARGIVQARPISTTTELADVIRKSVPTRDEVKSLSRVFQALRIAVNAELEVLEQVLATSVQVLKPGGRIAVISYHSLEDRRVKRFFRYGNLEGKPVRDFFGNLITPWHDLTRKPIEASADEIAANPRARSARLRVAARRADEQDEHPLH